MIGKWRLGDILDRDMISRGLAGVVSPALGVSHSILYTPLCIRSTLPSASPSAISSRKWCKPKIEGRLNSQLGGPASGDLWSRPGDSWKTIAMGRPEETLDRDGSPVREFAFWLRDLRRCSGLTYEGLAKSAHYATSTMQAATASRRSPTLRVTVAFVKASGGDERAWRAYWAQARRLLDEGAPGAVNQHASPPWAAGDPPAPASQPADGWYIESFTALLRLDAEPIEALERRRIVATADGVSELVASVSVQRHPGAPDQAQRLESELFVRRVHPGPPAAIRRPLRERDAASAARRGTPRVRPAGEHPGRACRVATCERRTAKPEYPH